MKKKLIKKLLKRSFLQNYQRKSLLADKPEMCPIQNNS